MKKQMIAVCLGFLGMATIAQADRNSCEARALEEVKSHRITRFDSINVKPVIIGRDYNVSVGIKPRGTRHDNYDVQFPNGCGSRAIVSERSPQVDQPDLSPLLNILNAPGSSDRSLSTNSAPRGNEEEAGLNKPVDLGNESNSTEAL